MLVSILRGPCLMEHGGIIRLLNVPIPDLTCPCIRKTIFRKHSGKQHCLDQNHHIHIPSPVSKHIKLHGNCQHISCILLELVH